MSSAPTLYKKTQVINQLHDTTYRWFAVRVKVKTEKYVAALLEKKGITTYVPIIHEIKHYKSKTKKVEKPLIHTFVFVKIVRNQYLEVLQTNYVLNFLRIHKDLICIPEEEIKTLQWVVGETMDFTISQRAFSIGQPVEVISGNLTGLQGLIVKKHQKKSFVVQLQSMGLELVIHIPATLLKALQKT